MSVGNLKEQIKDINDRVHKEQMWAKPANDIISGIEYNDKVPPVRAIWELVQNAHDVSIESGSDIVFERDCSEFRFSHNGLPFEIENLQALNIQTSSKVRNSTIQIGQYGTGFLTTHLFGLKFKLTSTLLYVLNEGNGNVERHYYHFDNLLFDRSTNDKRQMIDNLQNQNVEINNIYNDNEEIAEHEFVTTFTYLQESNTAKRNVEEAFEKAPYSAPYVIALNKNINSISFKDSVLGTESVFEKQTEEIVEQSELWTLCCVEIDKKSLINSSVANETLKIYVLNSSEQDENEGSVMSILLPFKHNGNKKIETFEFDRRVAKLFLRLPLVGSEEWG